MEIMNKISVRGFIDGSKNKVLSIIAPNEKGESEVGETRDGLIVQSAFQPYLASCQNLGIYTYSIFFRIKLMLYIFWRNSNTVILRKHDQRRKCEIVSHK